MRKAAFSVSLQRAEGQKKPPEKRNHAGNDAVLKEKGSVKHARENKSSKRKQENKSYPATAIVIDDAWRRPPIIMHLQWFRISIFWWKSSIRGGWWGFHDCFACAACGQIIAKGTTALKREREYLQGRSRVGAQLRLQGGSHESSIFQTEAQHRMFDGGQREKNSHTEKEGQRAIKTRGWRMKKRTDSERETLRGEGGGA